MTGGGGQAGDTPGIPQRGQELFTSRVVVEDGFAAVPPTQDVVDRAGILDSELARHGRDAGGTTYSCQ